jgi:hypothetical protein
VPSESRQAWREKVTLCYISLLLCIITVFVVGFATPVLCPTNNRKFVPQNVFGGVALYGKMFDAKRSIAPFNSLYEGTQEVAGGFDVSRAFKAPDPPACAKLKNFAFASDTNYCDPDCLELDQIPNFRPFQNVLLGRNIRDRSL